MPGRAILSAAVKSLSERSSALLVLSQSAVALMPERPITSAEAMPLALDQSVMKPGAPIPAISIAPLIMPSLMTLPPSSSSQLVLSGPSPAFSACFSSRFWSCITMSGR